MSVKSNNELTQCIAAKAIIEQDRKILVLKQSGEASVDGANRYHPPGGIVEPGEHLQEAVVREVYEETGMNVMVGDVLSVEEWRVTIRGEGCQFFGVFFKCSLQDQHEITLQEAEASGYAWVGLEELSTIDILEPSLSVIRKVLA